jgi:hypothetical protein
MVPVRTSRSVAGLFLVVLLGACASCGDGRQTTYPVQGQLTIEGKPAPYAELRFYEVHGRTPAMSRPYATTDQEGRFWVSSYGMHDGAPPGEYRVSVSWKGPLDGVSPDQRDSMPEQLPERFTDPATSGIVVRVIGGENRLETIEIVP